MLENTDTVNLAYVDGALEASARVGKTLEIADEGVRVRVHPTTRNAIQRRSNGLYVPDPVGGSLVAAYSDPQAPGTTNIDSTGFSAGFLDDTGSSASPAVPQADATPVAPLNAQIRGSGFGASGPAPSPFIIGNDTGVPMALTVQYGHVGALLLRVRTGQFITLKFQVSVAVNGGAFGGWSTYSEVGCNNTDPVPDFTLRHYPSPRSATLAWVADGESISYLLRTLVCWREPLPAPAADPNYFTFGTTEILAIGVA